MNDYVLDLSLDAVRLFEREASGLVERGAISLSEPHVADRLGELRREIRPEGALAADVVIPDSQILYLRLSPESAGPEAVTATLERTTPYALDELAWTVEPGHNAPCLAATTRQTLSEAREFATSNGFEPRRILAHPTDDGFPAEMTFEGAPDATAATVVPEPAEAEPTETDASVTPEAHAPDAPTESVPENSVPESTPPRAAPAVGLDGAFVTARDVRAPDRGVRAVDPRLGRTRPIRPRQRDDAEAEDATPPPEPAVATAGTRPRREPTSSRRKPLIAAGVAGLAVVALGGALAIGLGGSDAPPESAAIEAPAPPEEPAPEEREIADLAPEPRGIPPRQESAGPDPEELADEVDLAVAETIPEPAESEPDAASITADPPPPVAPVMQDIAAPDLTISAEPDADAESQPVPEVVTRADAPSRPDLLTLMPLPAAEEPEASGVPADPEPQVALETGEDAGEGATAADEAAVVLSLPVLATDGGATPRAPAGLGTPRLGFAEDVAPSEQATVIPEAWIPADDAVTDPDETLQAGAEGPQTRPRPRPDGGGQTANPSPAVEAAGFTSTAPETRPANFAALARQARADTSAAPGGSAAPQASLSSGTPAGAPNVAVRPATPSPPSVTREATTNNVIRLNQINLVGVYGSSSDRRALIRLPSGRYQKVEVGDPLDGGRVEAIGSSELRYLKSGRSTTLRIPQG